MALMGGAVAGDREEVAWGDGEERRGVGERLSSSAGGGLTNFFK